jgi:autotransporter-associated beta strand protein
VLELLTLSATNGYTGSTKVNAGTLKLNSTGAVNSSSGVTVATGAVLDLNGQNYATSIPLTLNGTGIASGGALINSSATGATWAGLVTLGSASSILGGTGTINLSNAGTITGCGLRLDPGRRAGRDALASIVGTGAGTLTKQDAGTWTLSGALAPTRARPPSRRASSRWVLPTRFPPRVTVTVTGTLDLNGFNDAVGSLAGAWYSGQHQCGSGHIHR